MSRANSLAAIAAGCAVSFTTVNADAAIVLRNATGQAATDFHIEFDGPADKLKVTSSTFGAGVTYPPPSPKQNQIDFGGSGGSVANGAELTLHGLRVVAAGKGVGVTSWYWTGPSKLTGEPLIKTGNTYTNLQELAERRLQIAAVPEPSTWALTILGFGLAGAALRRRRRDQVVLAMRRLA